MRNVLIACSLVLLTFQTQASDDLVGKVVRVLDGDTIELLDANMRTHRIRLAGVDAPEKAQAYGARAKQCLADKVYGQNITAQTSGSDRYGRLIGRLFNAGADVNLALVQEGCAWVYRQYVGTLGARAAMTFVTAEVRARAEHRGLWQDAHPEPPWQFRREK